MREVTVLTTEGAGSMDRYGRELARRLRVRELRLRLSGTSAGLWSAPFASRRALRALRGDAGLVRVMRRRDGLLHLANHHLGRYARLLRRPLVITAHDVIRYLDARGGGVYITRPGRRDRLMILRDYDGIAAADAVIAPSLRTKEDLVRHLRLTPERIHVVPMGIDHRLFRPVEPHPHPRPYLLFVGSEHPRKNLRRLLEALALVKRRLGFGELQLVKVGAAGSSEAPFRLPTLAHVRRLGLQDDVIFAGEVPDAELSAWYAGAACLVLPSLYEGFGFPALEAFACGCPVVASTAGALPEVAGDAARLCDPDDAAGLAEAIAALLSEESARAELRRRGRERARAFTWERTARETRAVYDAVLGGRAAP